MTKFKNWIRNLKEQIISWFVLDGDSWYKDCYNRMESTGIAVFGCCRGAGDDLCNDCPHFVDCDTED